MKSLSRKFFSLLSLMLFLLWQQTALAMPNIKVDHGVNIKGYAYANVNNLTNRTLKCTIAIDGYKLRFTLRPHLTSPTYTATDKRFNFSNFSVTCDYADN